MPDLNYRNPQVQQAMTQVALDWLARGADGFRLDAIRYLIETGGGKGQADVEETHAFLRRFAAALRAKKPDVALIGEVWAGTDTIAPYYGEKGDELTALFDFPLAMKLVNAVVAGDATLLSETLQDIAATYPAGATDAPFLTNHDQTRLATVLKKNPAALGLAAALLLTLPGSPFLYYGEELGLANGPGNEDQWKRTPMPWTEGPGLGFTTGKPWHATAPEQLPAPWSAQTLDPRSLLSRYRALLRARHASPALSTGAMKLLEVGTSAALAFTRTAGEETVLVVHNFSTKPRVVAVPLAPKGSAEPLFLDELATVERAPGGWSVSLPPQGTAVVRLP
jgi:glycosidase